MRKKKYVQEQVIGMAAAVVETEEDEEGIMSYT